MSSRIVLTHPCCWPYVRRGSERNLDHLARYLTARGHQVTTISTKPGRGEVQQTESGTRILHPTRWHPILSRIRIKATHSFFFSTLESLRRLETDLVYSLYFFDSLAASLARRRAGYKTILQLGGVPIPGVSCHRWLPPDAKLVREAIWRADCLVSPSQFIREQAREHYGKDTLVMPPIMWDVDELKMGSGPPEGRPTILSLADFNERRKGVRVLVQAFRLVREELPDAVLRLSGHMSPSLREELMRDLPEAVRSGIQILGVGEVEEVPRLYREASVTVIPSMWEWWGNTKIESWASGTPVVATDHAGLPESFIEGVGVLFDPQTDQEETMNVEGLAQALIEGIALSETSGTRALCRAHAEQFCSKRVGPRLEALFARTLGGGNLDGSGGGHPETLEGVTKRTA